MAVVSDVSDGDSVEDAEVLFRRVRIGEGVTADGKLRLSSQAFNDRGWKPSVNRHALMPDPAETKQDESDGVVQLVASEVRAVGGIVHNPNDPPDKHVTYKLDVLARPIAADNPEGLAVNPAHAQVESDPDVASRTRFDKVKDALARLAERRGWVIEPQATA